MNELKDLFDLIQEAEMDIPADNKENRQGIYLSISRAYDRGSAKTGRQHSFDDLQRKIEMGNIYTESGMPGLIEYCAKIGILDSRSVGCREDISPDKSHSD